MRLRTICLISTLALGLFAAPLPAMAQKAGKVYRIGYLRYSCGSLATNQRYIEFRKGLRELGYIEGQNFVIEYRCAERKRERRSEIAAEMVRLKVDVIVTPGAPPMIRAAERATRTIPIVVAGFRVNPVPRYVDSLARPGGNLTGLTNRDGELYPKRLELLKEAIPTISRVAILWTPRLQKRWMKIMEAAGQALGIKIQSVLTDASYELESAFSAILHAERAQPRESSRGLIVVISGITPSLRARVIEFTAKRRLPTIYYRNEYVNEGGLMSYSADRKDLDGRLATYVDKILKGANPANLPIEQPTKFDFVINLKTAEQLGITIPPEVLYRATKVIK